MNLEEDLLRHEAYGSLRPTRVDLAETHISWVFLLERDVFKVKKPVDLGFLDFRFIEQRKAACDAELRLNTRLSSNVYRGVVPIRLGGDGHHCVDTGHGLVVDWAVHMARLPDEQRADLLLERGALSGEAIDAIAARIASFHASARGDENVARFGTAEAVEQNIAENFEQVGGRVETYLRAEQAEEIARWQTAFVRGHQALFAQRIAGGHVRDGHGDLRLEHVYFPAPGPPTIIDCIEFNDRFRFADVCADIAFLSMDLGAHGRVDLAERLLARYARDANDFDMYALVDFYESYRAYVRGKIATIVAADERMDSDTRQRAEREARRHFLLSLSSERKPLLSPVLVAVGGIIACGKSTIAERVGLDLSAPVIDADRTRKGILGVDVTQPVHESAWKGAYDPAFTERVYAEMFRQGDVVLASGRPLVIDASFRSRSARQAVHDLAMRHNVPFRFIECRSDPAVCRARLMQRARGRGVSDGRVEIFDSFAANFEPVVELAPGDHLVLDTTRPLDETVDTLRKHLDAWPPGFVS